MCEEEESRKCYVEVDSSICVGANATSPAAAHICHGLSRAPVWSHHRPGGRSEPDYFEPNAREHIRYAAGMCGVADQLSWWQSSAGASHISINRRHTRPSLTPSITTITASVLSPGETHPLPCQGVRGADTGFRGGCCGIGGVTFTTITVHHCTLTRYYPAVTLIPPRYMLACAADEIHAAPSSLV